MNASGQAVAVLAERFNPKPESPLVVVYDDMDLTLGTVRLRPHGSAGTHNGMRSVIRELGSGKFPRLRLGIGPRPSGVEAEDFVLSRFSREERPIFESALEEAARLWSAVVEHGFDLALSKFQKSAKA